MIIVDTNVVAEVMRPSPSPTVVTWLNKQPAMALFLSAITLGEIHYGLRILPRGRRREMLLQAFERIVSSAFADRILAFGERAATHYGEVMARRREIGRPMSVPDGQIAALARLHGFAVATRNVRDFLDCGIEVLNPFASQPPA